jgi:hypothetical protein
LRAVFGSFCLFSGVQVGVWGERKALPTRICLVHVCHDTQLSYNENKMHTTNELNNARLPCGRTIDEIRGAVAAGKVS